MTQRMLSPMQEADCEKMKRFLILFKSIRNKQNPVGTKIIRYDRRLMKAKDYIDKYFAQELPLPFLANYVGLAKETLCRMFHRQLSGTYTNYVNNVRIEKSIPLLLYSDYIISDIAYECGFNSNHYFNRTFRKVKGVSPGMFRRGE
jgi:two-component system, response regulator YesN